MPLSSNKLTKQVDLPVFEWLRPLPILSGAGISCSAVADAPDFNEISGRFIYLLLNATNFWRYDTVSDAYIQLASPGITPVTASTMRFSGAQGYYGRAIAATSTTLQTGLPYGASVNGYRIRIISGKGAGQERLITSVADPIIADFGAATAGAATTLTDTNKNWGLGAAGTSTNLNNWVGYTVRIVGGTGIGQFRKILYNSATVLTIADVNIYAYDSWSVPISPTAGTAGWTAPAAGSLYQIESSVITVDTAWDVTPDNTSRYVIQSGAVILASGATVAAGGFTMQYYSVIEDIWYAKGSMTNIVPTLLTENCLERLTENSSLWYSGLATSATSTSITDTMANWTTNQFAGYIAHIWSGTGKGQLGLITSNTSTALTFSNTLSPAPDTTSRYNITGYDGGTLSSATGRIIFDTTKSWTVNRWANYAVRIVAGTGIGQTRQILSNGSDSIIVYDAWNVQPDNTSVYIIQGFANDMFVSLGGNSSPFLYRGGDTDIVTHGRIYDEGILQVACAMLTDGVDTTTHVIYDQKPVAITSLSGTTTITATTAQPHQFKVGQYVSIRGVTSAAADVYNVTGKVAIATVPSNTTFTYTPFSAGSGTYQYSNNVAIGTSALIDASKYHADVATGGSTTSVTFSRAQPSNINGWYIYGTNIAAGAQIESGAGTTTLSLNLTGGGTPTGTITMTKFPLPVTATYSSGGAINTFSLTLSGNVPAYCKGWLVTGTNIGLGALLTGGEGSSTINVSIQSSGTPSGTITFSNQVNNPLPATRTYSSGSGTSIVLTANSPTYVTGWYVSGTNIANGTTVTGGAGTSTITLSTATVGTPSGTITFYPPSLGPVMYYGTTAAPALSATGLLATGTQAQLVAQNTSNGTIMIPLAAVGGAVAAVSKYAITTKGFIAQKYVGQNINYLQGVALGAQSTTAFNDTNSFWATATGSGGSAGATSFTISAIGSPIHNGWYVSGTGIAAGSRVVSGGGTTTITVDTPMTASASGTITFTAWAAQGLINRRLRVISSTGTNQDLAITAVAPTTGTLTISGTAAASGSSAYAILPEIFVGAGHNFQWISDSSVNENRGRYIFRFHGGATSRASEIDLTTDQFRLLYINPQTETLGSGSMYAYDQYDRIYFMKDVTNRLYYIDVNTHMVFGAGVVPYLAGTANLGNLMEIFKTKDGLKYLWVNRKAQVEAFRQLVFY